MSPRNFVPFFFLERHRTYPLQLLLSNASISSRRRNSSIVALLSSLSLGRRNAFRDVSLDGNSPITNIIFPIWLIVQMKFNSSIAKKSQKKFFPTVCGDFQDVSLSDPFSSASSSFSFARP